MSRGKDVLDVIRHSIMKRIISEAQTNNLESINRNRNITTEKHKISEEFYVELHDENLTIQYKTPTLIRGSMKRLARLLLKHRI